MNKIEIEGTTVAERSEWLKNLLSKHVCDVTFTKVNGETRTMPCTLKSGLLPPAPVKESTKKINPDNLSVWCVDKNEWRSFKIMNVTEVTVL